MKRMKWMGIVVAVLILASFTIADAQRWGGKGKWARWGANYYHWNWDPATVETVKGEVMTKDAITPPRRSGLPAVGMTLKKEDAYAVYVHLGPQWYIDKQELAINVGDKVEVTGSRSRCGEYGPSGLFDQEGDKTWQLRD